MMNTTMARAISSTASQVQRISLMSPASSFVMRQFYETFRSRFKGNAMDSVGAHPKFTDKKQDASASCSILFHNVLQSHLQNGTNMVVRQRIEDIFALPAEFDQMHLLQDP